MSISIGFIVALILYSLSAGLPYLALAGTLALCGAAAICREVRLIHTDPEMVTKAAVGSGFALLLFLGSDWFARGWTLYTDPDARAIILLAIPASAIALRFLGARLCGATLLIAALVLPLWHFIDVSQGRLIFSDDHATFLYRLQSLKENFPFIPYYNPEWNFGSDERYFFATGVLNAFFIFSPIIYAFDLVKSYNFIVIGALFLLPIAAIWTSGRYLGMNRVQSCCAAVIYLQCNLLWYRWGLKYGTLGFVTSTALLPLNAAISSKCIFRPLETKFSDLLLLTISFSLMLLWSASGIAFLPLVAAALFRCRRLIRVPALRNTALVLIAVNLPWIIIFLHVSKVKSFVVTPENPHSAHYEQAHDGRAPVSQLDSRRARHVSLQESAARFQRNTVSFNPILLVLAVPGVLLLGAHYRAAFSAIALWLLALGCIAAPLKPQLELERMLIVLSVFLALPAGAAAGRLIDESRKTRSALASAALTMAFMVGGIQASTAIAANRSVERFSFADPYVFSLAEAIRENAGDGRTVFAGFVLQDLSGGHLAPLAYFSGKPLVASSPIHNLWRYTDVMPDEFRARGERGVNRYLDLVNASLVAAHERNWKRYFRKRSQRYREIGTYGPFALFARNHRLSSYFLEGDGEILEQKEREVALELRSPSAVISFRYLPFLTAGSCSLHPRNYGEEMIFIALSGCKPGEEIVLKSEPVYRRVMR